VIESCNSVYELLSPLLGEGRLPFTFRFIRMTGVVQTSTQFDVLWLRKAMLRQTENNNNNNNDTNSRFRRGGKSWRMEGRILGI
jgi:hypothetical protein